MPNIDDPQTMKMKRMVLEIGHAIDNFANGKTRGDGQPYRWAVLLWPTGRHQDGGNYLSNAKREDVAEVLRIQLAKFASDLAKKGAA